MDAGTQDVVVGYYWSREDGLVYNRAGIEWKDSLSEGFGTLEPVANELVDPDMHHSGDLPVRPVLSVRQETPDV